ncbi:Putative flagellar basal body protein [Pelagophyceae sp. CCMP2097]|nr:Putative flagellar basal body protein [Pelagophyceae sp. CCMP2097]|mmetsp:Transcript_104/g.386  ORF Transcript_104/g.386 Transcript_104/m.386 type:complete len:285 (-) Transcript_104:299-1153(-)
MVVIHVKYGADDEFLFETACATSNDELIRDLVEVNNSRVQLSFLSGALKDLAKYGPNKPGDEQGIDELKEQLEGISIEKSANYCADPTGQRTGNGVGPQLAAVFEKVCAEAEAYVSRNQAKARKALTKEGLADKLANMRGACAMAFPMGLPKWDSVFCALESTAGLEGTQAANAILDASTAQLWCAGREFARGETVGDRLGKNEKTKVVAKLQKPGAGAPAREPVVSEDERKAMMAHYFKRQEELKQLAESNEDEYLNSAWADTKQLKNSLQGMTRSVAAPGLR